MIQQPDIAVYSPDNKLQLIVEVKNKKEATPEWAAKMRRNLAVHSIVPYSSYFLLALPDHFYLWKNTKIDIDERLPDYTANSKLILEPYLKNFNDIDAMNEYSLELIVNSWLNKMITANLTKETIKDQEAWVLDSGLYDSIKHGHIKTESKI